jgi:hypothetical protein
MKLFGKKKDIRQLTGEEEKDIKKNILKQILSKTESEIVTIKTIKDLTNLNTGEAKTLFFKLKEEVIEEMVDK